MTGTKMKKKLPTLIAAILLSLMTAIPALQAQGLQSFRMAEGFVRIAEAGQLADTLTVWGDISNSGRYIVPRGTKPHELIGYARGVQQRSNSNEVQLDWSKLRIEINISSYNSENQQETVENFEFFYNDPFPEELRQYTLKNDQIISLELKRRPTIRDYIGLLSPVISITLTTILLIDRLQN